MKRQDLIDRTREMMGTPFLHQGRLRGKGLDCAGLIITSSACAGHEITDIKNYSRRPDAQTLIDGMMAGGLFPIPVSRILPGDVLLFHYDSNPQHVALVSCISPLTVIHATNVDGKVVEHTIDDSMRKKIYMAFSFNFEE